MNALIKRLARLAWQCSGCGNSNSDSASNCGGCGRAW